jgi:hypothetical protein
MTKSCKHAALVAVLCLGALSSGCYGPFNATKRLHRWNGQVDGAWGNEGVFLLITIIPVYGLFMLGDALIFNSIEFWGGTNPVSPTVDDQAQMEVDQVAAISGLPVSLVAAAPGLAR